MTISEGLTRERIVGLLGELVHELLEGGTATTIRIMGGAAIALMYSAGREATVDIDALFGPEDAVLQAAAIIRHDAGDLPRDWFNGAAAQFLPNGYGRDQEWIVVYRRDDIQIFVSSTEMLLAMKLHACQRRGLRDSGDIPYLMAAGGIADARVAESIYEDFYPGDELTMKGHALLQRAAELALTTKVTRSSPAAVGAEIEAAQVRASGKSRRPR
ncbi:MAG: hypothetical protein ACTHZX_04130 [Microbacterium sp.]